MTAALLAADRLGRVFDNGTAALEAVSLSVPPGAFVALLGPSGCGKSTLLRLVAGLDTPTSGRLGWPGGAPRPGDIGFVFQDPTLLPWADVWENVYLPLRLEGRARAAAAPAVEAAIAMVGLGDFAHARPAQLSGGMRMRVSVARALATRPRLLLMDEPFAALDEITRLRLNEDLLQVWRDTGATVLFVTHSVFEAVFLAERVIVMSPRPGAVAADIPIELPYPRNSLLRTEPHYGVLCRQVSAALAAVMR